MEYLSHGEDEDDTGQEGTKSPWSIGEHGEHGETMGKAWEWGKLVENGRVAVTMKREGMELMRESDDGVLSAKIWGRGRQGPPEAGDPPGSQSPMGLWQRSPSASCHAKRRGG